MLGQKNILDRLRIDPGHRTLGQLLQDREAALHEAQLLRREIERLRHIREDQRRRSAAVESTAGQRYFRPGTLEKYLVLPGTYQFTVRLRPFGKGENPAQLARQIL